MSDNAEGSVPEAEVETGDHPEPQAEDKSKSRFVPYARFAQVTHKLNETIERLNQTLAERETRTQGGQNPPEKTFTPAELRAKVDSGELSPEDAERIREAQLTKRVVEEVVGTTRRDSQERVWAEELGKYENAIPALKDQTSDEFARVKDEYRNLCESLGYPAGLNTMLAATRAVFGPSSALKAPAGSKPKVEPHEDVGGEGASPLDKDKTPVRLSKREQEHYRKAIDRGAYSGWDAVYDEVRKYGKRKG